MLNRTLELAIQREAATTLAHTTQDAAQRIARLSEYDRKLLNLIQDGASNKELAVMLAVSPRTIERRRSLIMQQLNVQTISEAVSLSTRSEYATVFDQHEPTA